MESKNPHVSDHLANERTLLAWIRTAIAVIAFVMLLVSLQAPIG